jgi:hypothetical protein
MVSTIIEIRETVTPNGTVIFEIHDSEGLYGATFTRQEATERAKVRRGVLRAVNTRRANKNRADGF